MVFSESGRFLQIAVDSRGTFPAPMLLCAIDKAGPESDVFDDTC